MTRPEVKPCPDHECTGHGYYTFEAGGDHDPLEIQHVQSCTCCDRRGEAFGGFVQGDAMAAILFTRDLEAGDQHAIECAQNLLEQHAPDWDGEAMSPEVAMRRLEFNACVYERDSPDLAKQWRAIAGVIRSLTDAWDAVRSEVDEHAKAQAANGRQGTDFAETVLGIIGDHDPRKGGQS